MNLSTEPRRTPRFDPYLAVHKGLRALMADTLLALGRLDCDDACEVRDMAGRIAGMLDLCRLHARHEDEFMHPAVEACEAGASQHAAIDHAMHDEAIGLLEASVHRLLRLPAEDRHAEALHLYRSLAMFVAHSFEHMHHEETVHNATLWAGHDDDAMQRIHDRLVAAVEPAKQMALLRWMLPAMTPAERGGLVRDLRAKMPPAQARSALTVLSPHLGERAYLQLLEQLDQEPTGVMAQPA